MEDLIWITMKKLKLKSEFQEIQNCNEDFYLNKMESMIKLEVLLTGL
jgi:hypothetical protein